MDIDIQLLADSKPVGVEIVERKGIGHPDTICDGIAEQISIDLCRYYLQHFGAILHHNVDKVLLCAGTSRPAFGGGEIENPIEIVLAGRATDQVGDRRIPVHEIATEACRGWLRRHVSHLDVDRDVRITPRIRRGSADLTRLFERGAAAPLANDTSCGVGFAPLSQLERMILEVERALNDPATKKVHPAIGPDVKVMGIRRNERVHLTVSCAMVDRHLAGLQEYRDAKTCAAEIARESARRIGDADLEIVLNAADDDARNDLFLTVTGTSAENGDDGQTGRGNRANGLITPNRIMTMEAAAGKNPVSHVGKLYSLVATKIARRLVAELSGVATAHCALVSEIGRAVVDPRVAAVVIETSSGPWLAGERTAVERIVASEVGATTTVPQELLEGRLLVY